MICIGCKIDFHYCISCGYDPDGELGSCYSCWVKSGARDYFNNIDNRAEDYLFSDENEKLLKEMIINYGKQT